MNDACQAIIDLDPSYSCRFLARAHPNFDRVTANVREFLLTSLPWKSGHSKDAYLKKDYEAVTLFGYPDGLEDRIELSTLYFSYLFFFDDVLETLDKGKAKKFMARMVGIMMQKVKADPENAYECVLEEICHRFLAVNDEAARLCATRLLKETCDYCIYAGEKEAKLQSLESFEAFKNYRRQDAGADLGLRSIQWNLAIYLPEHLLDSPKVKVLIHVTGLQATLINDLYSYRIEALKCEGENVMFNSVAVIMRERNVQAQAAMDFLKEEITKLEAEFVEVAGELRASHQGEDHKLLTRYIRACEHVMSGNWKWSSFCGRYNSFDLTDS